MRYKTLSNVDVDYLFDELDLDLRKYCQFKVLSWNKDKKLIKAYGYKKKDLIVIYTNRPGWVIGKQGKTIYHIKDKLKKRIEELNEVCKRLCNKNHYPEERYRDAEIQLTESTMIGTFCSNDL